MCLGAQRDHYTGLIGSARELPPDLGACMVTSESLDACLIAVARKCREKEVEIEQRG
jgi:hypothetical protein